MTTPLWQTSVLGIESSALFHFSIDKPKALSLLLHTADISHPAKSWDLHHRWTTSLLEEFFRQVSGCTWQVTEKCMGG